jgi:LacI family transcriptional regulator
MSATLKDLAEHLNLSTATVSRALNNKGRISEETCSRVLKAAQELNYRPNETARALKMNRTSTIGVIIPDATNIFFSKMLRSIDRELFGRGYSIIFCDSDESVERETEYFYLLKSKNVSGMIIVTAGSNEIYRNEESLADIVFVDNIPAIDRKFSFVDIDNVQAAYDLTQLAIDYGHRDIAVICADLNETTGFDRLQGYRKCVADNGLRFRSEHIFEGSFRFETGYETVEKLLRLPKLPTAVFAQNNMQAYGLIKGLREHAIRVPDDISVVCFDAIDETGMMSPRLTCVMQPVEEIGRQAALSILKNIDNAEGAVQLTTTVLGYKIVVGESLKRI